MMNMFLLWKESGETKEIKMPPIDLDMLDKK
jgi:hypothetical protein